jgi:hypothetical protein
VFTQGEKKMSTLQARRALKTSYVNRMEKVARNNLDNEFVQMGANFARASIGPTLIGALLVCDARTVRGWFKAEATPRKGDAMRLTALHAKVKIALENGDLPHEGNIDELIDILKKSKATQTTV